MKKNQNQTIETTYKEITGVISQIREEKYKNLDFLLNEKGREKVNNFLYNSASQRLWNIIEKENTPLIEVNTSRSLKAVLKNYKSIFNFFSSLSRDFFTFYLYFEINEQAMIKPVLFLTINETYLRQKVNIHPFHKNNTILKAKIRENNIHLFEYLYYMRERKCGEKFQCLSHVVYYAFCSPILTVSNVEQLTPFNLIFTVFARTKRVIMENRAQDLNKIITREKVDLSLYQQHLDEIFSFFGVIGLQRDDLENIKEAFHKDIYGRSVKQKLKNAHDLKLLSVKHVMKYLFSQYNENALEVVKSRNTIYEAYFTNSQINLFAVLSEAGIVIPPSESFIFYKVPGARAELYDLIRELIQSLPIPYFAAQVDMLVNSKHTRAILKFLKRLEAKGDRDKLYLFNYLELVIKEFLNLLEFSAGHIKKNLPGYGEELKKYVEKISLPGKGGYFFNKNDFYTHFGPFIRSGDILKIILSGPISLAAYKLMVEINHPVSDQPCFVFTANLKDKWLGMIEIYTALRDAIAYRDVTELQKSVKKYPRLTIARELTGHLELFTQKEPDKNRLFQQLQYYLEQNNLPESEEGKVLYAISEQLELSAEFLKDNRIFDYLGFNDYREYKLIRSYYRKSFAYFQENEKMFGKLYVNLSFVQKVVYYLIALLKGEDMYKRQDQKNEISRLAAEIRRTSINTGSRVVTSYTDLERAAADRHVRKIKTILSDSANKVIIDKRRSKLIIAIKGKNLSKDRRRLEDNENFVEYNLSKNITDLVLSRINELALKNLIRILHIKNDTLTIGSNSPDLVKQQAVPVGMKLQNA